MMSLYYSCLCLQVIYSGENRLQTLPTRFGELVNLEELDVSGCELVSLPDSLSQCESLVRLWLSNNRYRGTRTMMVWIWVSWVTPWLFTIKCWLQIPLLLYPHNYFYDCTLFRTSTLGLCLTMNEACNVDLKCCGS